MNLLASFNCCIRRKITPFECRVGNGGLVARTTAPIDIDLQQEVILDGMIPNLCYNTLPRSRDTFRIATARKVASHAIRPWSQLGLHWLLTTPTQA